MAVTEAAMVLAQAPLNWYGIVASRAAIGAAINSATSLWGQHLARKHEDGRSASKRAASRNGAVGSVCPARR